MNYKYNLINLKNLLGKDTSEIKDYLRFNGINKFDKNDIKSLLLLSQKMTVDEALMATTYGGAYQMRQENIRGTIEKGKKADLIILDTNLLENHEVKTLETKVLIIMVNGNIVYAGN